MPRLLGMLIVMGAVCVGGFWSAQAASKQMPAQKLIQQGAAAFEKANYAAALAKFTKACALKNSEACSFAALTESKIADASKDPVQAIAHKRGALGFDRKACDLGGAASCLSAANQADQLREFEIARDAGIKACTMKIAAGCTLAGRYYRGGIGGPVDKPKALSAYKSGCIDPAIVASKFGPDPQACSSYRLWKGSEAMAAEDWKTAEAGYLEACDGGIFEACHNAGVAAMNLSNAAGMGEDYKAPMARAQLHFRKACEKGVTQSCTM